MVRSKHDKDDDVGPIDIIAMLLIAAVATWSGKLLLLGEILAGVAILSEGPMVLRTLREMMRRKGPPSPQPSSSPTVK